MNKGHLPIKRTSETKSPLPKYLIVTEGTKTERYYFEYIKDHLSLSAIDIEVSGVGKSPTHIVEKAINIKDKKKIEYDKIWCVFDIEINRSHINDVEKALCQIKQNRFHPALTNPYFEYWYILHYDAVSPRITSRKGMEKELKKYYTKYNKTHKDILPELFPRIKTAISNAKKILKSNHFDEKDIQNNFPSTNVHLLIEQLLPE